MLNFLRAASLVAATGKTTGGGPGTVRHSALRDAKATVTDISGSHTGDSQWAHAIIDFIGDAVVSTDTEARITYINTAAETLTGFTRKEAVGRPLQDIFRVIDVTTREPRQNLAREVMNTGCTIPLHNSALLITRDGNELAIEDAAKPLHNSNGEIVGAIIKFHDSRYSAVTTARQAYLAQHDALTGVLNRHAFTERFEQAAALAKRHQKKMALLFIDLDNFKAVNDTHGHSMGDAILKMLGRKLLSSVRTTDHVCRYGGDEFLLLLGDLTQHEQAFTVVDKVRTAAAELSRLSAYGTALDLSIGISIYPDHGTTLDTLLPHADADMYRVKEAHQKSGK